MVAEISVAVSATQAIIISDLSGSQAPAGNAISWKLRFVFPSQAGAREGGGKDRLNFLACKANGFLIY